MITITDSFSLNAVSNKGEGFDANFRVRRIKSSEIKETVAELVKTHNEIKSILQTKKVSEDFTKLLGIHVEKFTSRIFTREDFMKVNRTNSLLYGELVKDKENDKTEYYWYLISIPE